MICNMINEFVCVCISMCPAFHVPLVSTASRKTETSGRWPLPSYGKPERGGVSILALLRHNSSHGERHALQFDIRAV